MSTRALKPQMLCQSDGLTVWLVQHDRERTWLECWYRMNTDGVEFDVRKVPGYTEHPRCERPWTSEKLAAHERAERQHHAQIITTAINYGWLPGSNVA